MIFKKKLVLITGSAGFVGFHMAKKLLQNGWSVIGVDNLNSYYDVNLKINRHKILKKNKNFKEFICSIEKNNNISEIILDYNPSIVIHMAAQAGVGYSIENPVSYMESNILGTFKIIEALKKNKIEHFLVASTSSVYGNSEKLPYFENDTTDFPISFYAASKKAVEVLTHSYSHLYNIPTTVFRFFTVYGPWGRPDMALFKFTDAIINNKPIKLFNNGNMKRDFTYIDDLIESIFRLIEVAPNNSNLKNKVVKKDSLSKDGPWRVVNIGNSNMVCLKKFVHTLEKSLNKKAILQEVDYKLGEVLQTYSSSELLYNLVKFRPNTPLKHGIDKFIDWYKEYYL